VKLGGIIGQVRGARVILGVGVNLWDAPAIPERAIAPAHLAGLCADPGALPAAPELARRVLDAWEDLEIHREPAFRWPEAGDRVQWEEGHGVCAGWMDDGRLAMDTAEGRLELVAGDVTGLSGDRGVH
jgi:hypothetical protein